MLSCAHLEQLFGLNDGLFPDGNITITSLVRGSDGQLRDLGGYTGLGINDGNIPQAISR